MAPAPPGTLAVAHAGESATIRHCSATVGSVDLGILSAMPDERIDPSQNTQAFQAWVDQTQSQPVEPAKSRTLLWAGVGVAVVVVVALVLFVALG
ncbi:hypothetical protein GCM10022255_062990 [Dactylosporangium darangshiense]|uniref:Uncharacterized protein n=1 Tax=Dactylosporangium darangshiense TaxID=579108 RepID=A0ABP8DG26_9ACTN